MRLPLESVFGNKIKKTKNKKKVKLLSLLNPFFLVMKLVINKEPIKSNNNNPFLAISNTEIVLKLVRNWNNKKQITNKVVIKI